MTEEQYLRELAGGDPPWEFRDGEVSRKPSLGSAGGAAVIDVVVEAFRRYRREEGGFGGPMLVIDTSWRRERSYAIADFAYWAPGRPANDRWEYPPTLAIEIAGGERTLRAARERCRLFRSRRVDACWLIEPKRRTVEVFDAGHDGTRLSSAAALTCEQLVGFALPVAALWSALDAESA